jgi:PII-like signaling protein
MDGYTNQKTLLRIYIGENDRYGESHLSEALVDLFNREGYPDAAVIKCIDGFGPQCSRQDVAYSGDHKRLPVIVELIACRGRINLILPRISAMMGNGMITMGTVKVARRCTNVNSREMHEYLQ